MTQRNNRRRRRRKTDLSDAIYFPPFASFPCISLLGNLSLTEEEEEKREVLDFIKKRLFVCVPRRKTCLDMFFLFLPPPPTAMPRGKTPFLPYLKRFILFIQKRKSNLSLYIVFLGDTLYFCGRKKRQKLFEPRRKRTLKGDRGKGKRRKDEASSFFFFLPKKRRKREKTQFGPNLASRRPNMSTAA